MKSALNTALFVGASLCLTSAAFAQHEGGPDLRDTGLPSDAPSTNPANSPTLPPRDVPEVRTTTTTTTTSVAGDVYTPYPYMGDTSTYWRRTVGAPQKAFELGVSTGYTKGFGELGAGRRAADFAGGGLDLGLSLGYRATPTFGLNLRGAFQELSPMSIQPDARARGMSAGVDFVLHMSPYSRVDFWGSLGVGYRLLWDVDGTEVLPGQVTNARSAAVETKVLRHGFELAKLELGADLRVSRNVALGPVVGADLNMLVWRDEGRGAGSVMMNDRGVSPFIYGGLQGRFDIGGERVNQWAARVAGR